MTKKYITQIRRIYKFVLCAAILITGICFILGCLSIYYSGAQQPYTRETVSAVFSKISTHVFLCLGLIFIDMIWEFISPYKYNPQKPQKAYKIILQRLLNIKDINSCDTETTASIKRERTSRKIFCILRIVIFVVCIIVFLCYALNPDNFHQSEINQSMIKAMYVLIPCCAVAFLYSVFAYYHNLSSIKREIDLIKQLPNLENKTEPLSIKTTNHKKQLIVKLSLLIVGLAALIYGFITGGVADVLTKAVNICTECIGLG